MSETDMARPSSRHKCALCGKRFRSEVKLLLHFQGKHVTPMLRDKPELMAFLEETEEGPEEDEDGQGEMPSTDEFYDPYGEPKDSKDWESDDEYLSSLDEQTCVALLCAGPFLFRKPPPTIPKIKLENDPLETGEGKRRRRRLKEEWREDFECIFCKKKFKPYQEAMFHYHLRVHTKEKPYFCEYCDESFARPNYLTKHTRRHVAANRFPCPLCGVGFTEVSHMKTHLRTHTLKKAIKCKVCKKGFYDQNKLNRHMLRHTNPKALKCKKCKRRFNRPESLQKHMLKKHNPEKPNKCRICGEEFYQPDVLELHMDFMHGPNTKKYGSKRRRKVKSAEFVLSD